MGSMATASPIDPIDPPLESAVRKLRAGLGEPEGAEPLTAAERAAVRRRGAELLEADLTDEPPSEDEPVADDDEEQDEDELFEDLVLLDADDREGRTGIPWREAFGQLGIPVPSE
jgi:hypothetical protein